MYTKTAAASSIKHWRYDDCDVDWQLFGLYSFEISFQ
jgi:hypothetical protein